MLLRVPVENGTAWSHGSLGNECFKMQTTISLQREMFSVTGYRIKRWCAGNERHLPSNDFTVFKSTPGFQISFYATIYWSIKLSSCVAVCSLFYVVDIHVNLC